MRVIAPGILRQGLPRLHRHFTVGLGRERQDHFRGIDVRVNARTALGRSVLGHYAIETAEQVDLVLGIPRDALAAIAELVHEGPERRKPVVEVWVVAFDHRHHWHGLAREGVNLALLPVLHVQRLGKFARRVVQDRHQHHVLLDAQHFRRHVGEFLRQALEDVPVTARIPGRVSSAGQRVNEGVHVGGVEVVLLVPGGGRQNDVGVNARRGHAEVECDQQVELSFRRLVVPDHVSPALTAFLAQILAHHAVRCAEQMFEEVFVALTGRTKQVGAPDEQIARPVGRVIRILARHLQLTRLELGRNVILRLLTSLCGRFRHLQRIGLQLGR